MADWDPAPGPYSHIGHWSRVVVLPSPVRPHGGRQKSKIVKSTGHQYIQTGGLVSSRLGGSLVYVLRGRASFWCKSNFASYAEHPKQDEPNTPAWSRTLRFYSTIFLLCVTLPSFYFEGLLKAFRPYIPALFLNFSRQEFIQSKNASIKFQFQFVYFPEKHICIRTDIEKPHLLLQEWTVQK